MVQFILERLVLLEEKAGKYEEKIRLLEKKNGKKDRKIAELEHIVQKETLDIEYLQRADENRPILKSKGIPNLERHGESLQIETQGLPGIQSVGVISCMYFRIY